MFLLTVINSPSQENCALYIQHIWT